MNKINLTFFILTSLFTSCNNHNKSFITEYTQGKDTVIRGFQTDRINNGPFIQYFPNKGIRSMWTSVSGKIEGKTLTYYPNGQIQSVKSFKNGNRHGYSYFFTPNQKMDAIELYLNDIKSGHGYYYDTTSPLTEYRFMGYYNSDKYCIRQIWNRLSKESKIEGSVFIDPKNILVDTINNETRIMAAKPFGEYKIEIDLRYAINRDKFTRTELLRITDFGEYVYSGNIIEEFDKHKIPLVFSTLTFNDGTQLQQNFFIRREQVKYFIE